MRHAEARSQPFLSIILVGLLQGSLPAGNVLILVGFDLIIQEIDPVANTGA